MTNMVERVAGAILNAIDPVDGFFGTPTEALARAAIEAMREPTEEMVQAMRGRALAADCLTDRGARDIYSNMHYAALKEPK